MKRYKGLTKKNINMVHNHKEYMREYNKRKREEYKVYWQTPKGKRTKRISEWKRSYKLKGDLGMIYDKFINTEKCEICDRILTDDKRATSTRKSMDHNHTTGYFRWICCHRCNTQMGHSERRFMKVIHQIKDS